MISDWQNQQKKLLELTFSNDIEIEIKNIEKKIKDNTRDEKNNNKVENRMVAI